MRICLVDSCILVELLIHGRARVSTLPRRNKNSGLWILAGQLEAQLLPGQGGCRRVIHRSVSIVVVSVVAAVTVLILRNPFLISLFVPFVMAAHGTSDEGGAGGSDGQSAGSPQQYSASPALLCLRGRSTRGLHLLGGRLRAITGLRRRVSCYLSRGRIVSLGRRTAHRWLLRRVPDLSVGGVLRSGGVCAPRHVRGPGVGRRRRVGRRDLPLCPVCRLLYVVPPLLLLVKQSRPSGRQRWPVRRGRSLVGWLRRRGRSGGIVLRGRKCRLTDWVRRLLVSVARWLDG